MRQAGRIQGLVALGLALGLHGAAFALMPSDSGAATAAGAGGEALVSMAAVAPVVAVEQVTDDLAALIKEWEAPPPVVETMPETPVAPVALPEMPELAPITPMPDMPASVALPVMDAAPVADKAPVAPEPVPELVPEPEPVKKPEPKPEPKKERAEPKREKPKKEKPVQPQAGSEGQVAAGSGGGATAGDGGKAQAATGAKGQDSIKAEWGATIRARVERRKSYPRGADGAQGRVKLRLTVDTGGNLVGVGITQSSGNAALDQAAVKAVQSARFPAAPKGLAAGQYSFNLPLDFKR
ncbi:energy transducer TonB [Neogemmobacter tilapiae]|uniref:TonB C-terminal domain-containing protein n=1 Tax=Neogemmobacter tilapiae TaxID=875041 RepID=A0A918WQ06_9RHOB|nr:energy transducer TonB [Gemmobacter tilapiae]GHC63333.1 hypothetical protein GCM10007315_29450 [Gemmobacter tilapiae]